MHTDIPIPGRLASNSLLISQNPALFLVHFLYDILICDLLLSVPSMRQYRILQDFIRIGLLDLQSIRVGQSWEGW